MARWPRKGRGGGLTGVGMGLDRLSTNPGTVPVPGNAPAVLPDAATALRLQDFDPIDGPVLASAGSQAVGTATVMGKTAVGRVAGVAGEFMLVGSLFRCKTPPLRARHHIALWRRGIRPMLVAGPRRWRDRFPWLAQLSRLHTPSIPVDRAPYRYVAERHSLTTVNWTARTLATNNLGF